MHQARWLTQSVGCKHPLPLQTPETDTGFGMPLLSHFLGAVRSCCGENIISYPIYEGSGERRGTER